ncbi:MAG TPA: hypothetical protein VG939_00885 [Caulobacteraceae bacterium]|nr:hypothetical protein [Caulobacteraceae bacterium]
MASIAKSGRYASVTLNPQHQSLENLQKLVAQMVGRGGCDRCGRVAYLHVDFLGDPPDEIARDGVISYQEGIAAH